MSKRNKVTRSGSKRLFVHTAQLTHPYNIRSMPMRGGFRI